MFKCVGADGALNPDDLTLFVSPHSPQPSTSCSFDGSLKSENSDSEPKWPEVPPVLNQNEDRRRNKYLRKDYLKVRSQAHFNSMADRYH